MGKSNSKIIDIKDAEKRCSMDEWKRFNEGYEEVIKGNKANRMDKRSFHNDVLGDWCPVELAYRIFDVFATKKDGFICKQEFLCGMAIFHRGTQLEQLGLLFTIYDEDGSGGISKQEMHKYLGVLRSLLPTDRKYVEILEASFRKAEESQSFFGGSQPELSFEVFKEWALSNMTPGLISWVFELFKTAGSANIGCCFAENSANSSLSTDNSWFKSDSKSDTRFFSREMAELESYYHRTTLASSKVAPLEAFAKQFPPNLKPELIKRLHNAFDKNKDGVVDANEFVSGMAACCRGTHDENVHFVFSLFDSDGDVILSRDELRQMVLEQMGIVKFRLPSAHSQNEPNRVSEAEVEQFVSLLIPEGTGGLSLDGVRALARSTRGFTGLLTLIREHAASELGIQPLDLQEEKRLVEPILPLNIIEMRQGDPVYVVAAKWYVSWMFYMGFDGSNYVRARSLSQCSGSTSRSMSSPKPPSVLVEDEDDDPGPPALLSQSSNMRPGEIDNSSILEETAESSTSPILKLKPNLKEFTDYIVVSPKLWFMLQRWYGGGPTIEREVIVAGDKSSTHLAELYPLVLNCRSTSKKGNQGRVVTLSRMGTVRLLRTKIASMMELEPDKIRLWDIYKEARPRLLEDKVTLESAQLVPEQDIYVETQMENGRWAGLEALQTQEEKSKVVRKQKNASSTPRSVRGQYNSGGVCGMYNLGNTCFMNSSLQCLSNARPLTYYFLSDYYLHEINKDNPLGSEQADLVMNYAKTIKKLWSAKPGSAISPRAFKAALGKFAPRFSGSQQQDAQELLSGVLDALHEDLNRVLKKPYVEDKDSAGRDDRVVAAEYWSNFRLRNQSVINDLFMAQLKSTLDFTCGFQSVRFDAYSCLSVPLPEPELEYVGVTVVFDDPLRIPTKYSIALAEDALISDLKAKITALCGCPGNTLQLLELDGTVIVRWLTNNVSIAHIKSATGIHAYEIPRTITPVAATSPDGEAEAARAAASKAEADALEKAKAAAAAEAAFDPAAADVGAQLDVLDTANQWLLADVLMTCKASKEMAGEKKLNGVEINPIPNTIAEGELMVYVHYQGWSARWDEWISTSNKKRFAVPNTKSVEAALKKQRGGVAFKPFNRNDELNVHKETIVLHFIHRKLELIPNFFFHPCKPVVFDIPILLFVLGANTSVASLYASIWNKVRRYTTSPSTKASTLFSRSPSKGSAPPRVEDVKEDNSPPFVLKHVKRNGTMCFSCPWIKGCLGCPLEYSEQPLGKQLEDASTIVIDWNPNFFKTFVRRDQLCARLAHASVAEHASKLADSAVVSIADCMAKFTIREVLDDQSTPRCSKCKDFHKNTTKTLELWSVPAVFIIHLKRLLPGRKLYTKVEAPLTNFDPSPFCASSGGKNRKSTSTDERKQHQLYDLFAVVNHYGSSLGGHYLAYALNKEDNQWYIYDDNHVAPLPADHPIITNNAYMLFYQRHDLGGGNSLDYIPPETLLKLQSQVGGRECAIS